MALSIFSCACWPFVYLLWRCIYSSPLPILKYLFIYSFLATLCVCCCSWAASRGCVFLHCASLQASHCSGFSCCRARALESLGFSSLWCMGLVALQHVGPSRTRDWTHVSCTGRWILNRWTTREAQVWCLISRNLWIFQFYFCCWFIN